MKQKYAYNNAKQLFFAILPVQILTVIVSYLGSLINGIIMGKYLTSLDVIVLGLTSPFIQIISVIASAIAAGSKVCCGRFIGRGEKEKVNETFTASLINLIFISLILTLCGFLLTNQISSLLGANLELIERTSSYIRGISIGILPTLIAPTLISFLQMKNDSNYAVLSSVVLAISNLVLGVCACELLDVDIFGIGVVTSICQYIFLAMLALRVIKNKVASVSKINQKSLYKDVIVTGLPTAVSGTCFAIRNTVLNSIAVNSFGTDVTNALSIMNASCSIFDSINIAVGTTMLMMVSISYGQKDKQAILTSLKVAIFYGVLLGLGKISVIFFTAKPIADIYGASEIVRNHVFHLYLLYGATMPVNIFTNCFVGVLQSTGKITLCNVLYLVLAISAPLSCAYFLIPLINEFSIWSSYLLGEIGGLIFLYIVSCVKHKKIVRTYEELLYLDETVEVGNHITISLNSLDDAIMVSKKIQDYCVKEGVDKSKSMIASLCAEEMAVNIIEHGFPKSKKKNLFIDIYADVDDIDKTINIRIQDNAVSFDPHIKINDDDITANIGIKMVSKLAKDMNYQNNFGLNVLTIAI